LIAALPNSEPQRIATLNSLGILDTPAEPMFDSVVQLAKSLSGSQAALISLVDSGRQWFKARTGLDARETPRDIAFCAHAILEDAVLCVSDASDDPRFSANPLVTGEPRIRSYIGAPILVRGQRIGTVCAFSPHRRDFDEAIREQFRLLAVLAGERMEARQKTAFISGLANATSDAVVAADQDQNITFWGGGAERMFGYTSEEVLGMKLHAIMPDRVRAAHDSGFAAFRRTGQSKLAGHTTELPARHRDGTEFPIDLNVTVWRDGGNVLIGGIMRDATERRSLAEARLVNEAQSRFLANMSHEIRTPLNGVLGIAQVLELGKLDDTQRSMVGIIKDSAEALNRLLSDILESARLDAGETVVHTDEFEIGELLSRVAGLHQGPALAKGLAFAWTPMESEAWVMGDSLKIGQVLGNLLSNAVKFTKTGEVGLSVTQHGDKWRFVVSDTGIGVPEDQQQRIFMRFQQADSSATRSHGGSGLGLSISRQLARAMEGTLSVHSDPGAGSQFCLTLPLLAAPPIAHAAEMNARFAWQR
jgi:PAS domain S-box-containing protein